MNFMQKRRKSGKIIILKHITVEEILSLEVLKLLKNLHETRKSIIFGIQISKSLLRENHYIFVLRIVSHKIQIPFFHLNWVCVSDESITGFICEENGKKGYDWKWMWATSFLLMLKKEWGIKMLKFHRNENPMKHSDHTNYYNHKSNCCIVNTWCNYTSNYLTKLHYLQFITSRKQKKHQQKTF
jgi:hypothetical protein